MRVRMHRLALELEEQEMLAASNDRVGGPKISLRLQTRASPLTNPAARSPTTACFNYYDSSQPTIARCSRSVSALDFTPSACVLKCSPLHDRPSAFFASAPCLPPLSPASDRCAFIFSNSSCSFSACASSASILASMLVSWFSNAAAARSPFPSSWKACRPDVSKECNTERTTVAP